MVLHTPDQQPKKRRPPEIAQPPHQAGQVSSFTILGGDHHIPGREGLLLRPSYK